MLKPYQCSSFFFSFGCLQWRLLGCCLRFYLKGDLGGYFYSKNIYLQSKQSQQSSAKLSKVQHYFHYGIIEMFRVSFSPSLTSLILIWSRYRRLNGLMCSIWFQQANTTLTKLLRQIDTFQICGSNSPFS